MLFCLPVFFSGILIAQPSVIKGKAPDYAGVELVFNKYTDYITYTEYEAGKTKIGANGDFEIKIEGKEITYLFFSIGIYKAYFFLEPYKVYEIVLPERKDKSETEKINPYFEETFVHIAIANEGDNGLNRQIGLFDSEFEKLFSEVIQGQIIINSTGVLDSIIQIIEVKFHFDANHTFFDTYRKYRYGFLRYVTMHQKSRSISDNLFLNHAVLYNNPAYMELFNQLYNKYFLFFGRTREGKKIYDDIGKYQSLSRLKKTLSSDNVLKEENLLEFVILKGLHDGFYSADFSRQKLLTILDSIELTTNNSNHRLISQFIRSKVTRLLVGYDPPAFELPDKEGKTRKLTDFAGKYVYLNFCTPASYSCLSEFETLQWLKNKHKENLEIVTVLVGDKLESMQEFLKIKPYNWTFLFYGDQPKILKEYDVRTFPTYYLIDRQGKLVISPAPSPSENFEMALFRIMRGRREL